MHIWKYLQSQTADMFLGYFEQHFIVFCDPTLWRHVADYTKEQQRAADIGSTDFAEG